MFRTAELKRTLSKKAYKERLPALRQELLEMQNELRRSGFPVIVVFGGVDGAGKSETVNILNEWMDPRFMITRAFDEPSDEERDRPPYWRFWRELPPNGRIGLFLSSWYSLPILDRVYGRIDEAEFDLQLNRVQSFEKALADDGALILKFWMHLSKEAQKARLKKLEKNPLLHWKISDKDWEHWQMYEKFISAAEHTLLRTSNGQAPWKIVEGFDERYRSVTVATILRDAIITRLEEDRVNSAIVERLETQVYTKPHQLEVADGAKAAGPGEDRTFTVLSALDMSQSLDKKRYNTLLHRHQGQLNRLQQEAKERRVSTIMVFEGWDAAGKGGAIRRVIAAIDARNYQVIPIAAPSDEEQAHHYLWRFWRHLPRAGRFTIFDRSWYGRVLVERIEGFATTHQWQRAYAEINDFEARLVEHGVVLLKFWIHITKEEQLARFQARQQTPYKSWKLTEEDWRNRERWEDYELAVNETVERTSTQLAPWTLVEGNDKRFARIKVLTTLCERLEAALAPARGKKKASS
ncbi:MAG: polyphosphate:AMP phosphotransferase [Candidatus Competibacteraceae bacterium]|nr:polyphosphate:AMP phosphotransferase [Candidatus Competibacteraceae bacterium]